MESSGIYQVAAIQPDVHLIEMAAHMVRPVEEFSLPASSSSLRLLCGLYAQEGAVMDLIIVTNPEECPFRYYDQEWGTYECTRQPECCDQGEMKKIVKRMRKPVKGAILVDYEEVLVFSFPPSCPFGGKSFTVRVGED